MGAVAADYKRLSKSGASFFRPRARGREKRRAGVRGEAERAGAVAAGWTGGGVRAEFGRSAETWRRDLRARCADSAGRASRAIREARVKRAGRAAIRAAGGERVAIALRGRSRRSFHSSIGAAWMEAADSNLHLPTGSVAGAGSGLRIGARASRVRDRLRTRTSRCRRQWSWAGSDSRCIHLSEGGWIHGGV